MNFAHHHFPDLLPPWTALQWSDAETRATKTKDVGVWFLENIIFCSVFAESYPTFKTSKKKTVSTKYEFIFLSLFYLRLTYAGFRLAGEPMSDCKLKEGEITAKFDYPTPDCVERKSLKDIGFYQNYISFALSRFSIKWKGLLFLINIVQKDDVR